MTLPGAAQVAAAAGSRAASIDEGAPELVRGAVHLVLDGEQVLKSVTCKGANQFYTGVELQNSMDAASLAAIQFERRVVRLRDWARAKCFTVRTQEEPELERAAAANPPGTAGGKRRQLGGVAHVMETQPCSQIDILSAGPPCARW